MARMRDRRWWGVRGGEGGFDGAFSFVFLFIIYPPLVSRGVSVALQLCLFSYCPVRVLIYAGV